MEKIIKIAQEHEEYTKLMSLIKKSLKTISNDEGTSLFEELKQFNDLFFSDGYRSKDLFKIMETHKCSQEVISSVIRHARKEDMVLIPILRKYENIF